MIDGLEKLVEFPRHFFGLEGWPLGKASCATCALIIFEIVRNIWWDE